MLNVDILLIENAIMHSFDFCIEVFDTIQGYFLRFPNFTPYVLDAEQNSFNLSHQNFYCFMIVA